jgi:hypothetical protein
MQSQRPCNNFRGFLLYDFGCAMLGGLDHIIIMNTPLTPVGGVSFTGGLEHMFLLPYELDSVMLAATETDVYISFQFPAGDFRSSLKMSEDLRVWLLSFLTQQGVDVEKLVGVQFDE